MERFVKIKESKPNGYFEHECLWYDNKEKRYAWLPAYCLPEYNTKIFWTDGYSNLDSATHGE